VSTLKTPFIKDLSGALLEVEHPLYLVGGSVRDLILGLNLNDLDVVVDGPLARIAEMISSSLNRRAIFLGRPPKQICRFVLPGLQLDLAELQGGSIKNELARRDLTVNAMAVELTPELKSDLESLLSGRVNLSSIVDPFNGQKDLKAKQARFVSEDVILQDPLRLLRLFRFAAAFDLKPHPDSLVLVERHAALVQDVAGERIREELLKTLAAPRAFPQVKIMADAGLLAALVPELEDLKGMGQNEFHHLDVYDHTLEALRVLEEIIAVPGRYLPDFSREIEAYLGQDSHPALLKLAVLLHDLGKPAARSEDEDGQVHFYKHEVLGEKMAADLARRLRFSKSEEAFIRLIVRRHLQPFHLFAADLTGTLKTRGVYRFSRLAGEHLWGLVVHALADAYATKGPAQLARGGLEALTAFFNKILIEIAEELADLSESTPLIGGADLMDLLNLKPSPLIGRLLNAIREAQAVGEVRDRDEALALAEALFEKWVEEG